MNAWPFLVAGLLVAAGLVALSAIRGMRRAVAAERGILLGEEHRRAIWSHVFAHVFSDTYLAHLPELERRIAALRASPPFDLQARIDRAKDDHRRECATLAGQAAFAALEEHDRRGRSL